MKRFGWAVLLLLVATGSRAGVLALTQNFDDVASSGWTAVNASSPLGTTSWFQGNPDIFSAQSGPANSYAAANFLSTDPNGGTISTWLISPEINFASQSLTFFARAADLFDDALNVRISLNGTSMSLGDFGLLLSINPGNVTGGMPTDWTAYSAMLADSGSGRIAFEYTASSSAFADYIGIDTVSIGGKSTVPEPGSGLLVLTGLAVLALGGNAGRRRRINIANAG